MLPEESSRPVDRRTILRGAAWAAPVIAFAVAAPVANASDQPAPPAASLSTLLFNGVAQNYPSGGSGRVEFQIGRTGGTYSTPSQPNDIRSIAVSVTVPKSAFTGAVQMSAGSGWSITGPVSDGDLWRYELNFVGILVGNGNAGGVRLTFALVVSPSPTRRWTGGTVQLSAVGTDTQGAKTPILLPGNTMTQAAIQPYWG